MKVRKKGLICIFVCVIKKKIKVFYPSRTYKTKVEQKKYIVPMERYSHLSGGHESTEDILKVKKR